MKRFKRRMAFGAWAVLATFLTAMPAAAAGLDDPPAKAKTIRLNTTLSSATLASLPPARMTEQDAGASGSTSFFKTPKGVAVLVLMGAGLGYTLYSKSHDRVMSPIR